MDNSLNGMVIYLTINSKQFVLMNCLKMQDKKARIIIAACLSSVIIINPAKAQIIPERENPGVHVNYGKQAAILNLYNGLNLSKDQQSELKALQKESRAQIKAITLDTILSAKERKMELLSIRENAEGKRKALLSDEQNKIFEINRAKLYSSNANADRGTVKNNISNLKRKDANGLSRKVNKKTSKNRWSALELSEEQRNKLKIWAKNEKTRLLAVRKNTSLSQTERRRRFYLLKQNGDSMLDDILNHEQKLKWMELQRELKLMRNSQVNINNNSSIISNQ